MLDFLKRLILHILNQVPEDESSHSVGMDGPIDISSTDSESDDWDLDKYKSYLDSNLNDTAASTSSRVLPSWASSSGSNATGHHRPNQKPPAPRKSPALKGNSLINSHARDQLLMLPSSSNNVRNSTSHTARDINARHSMGNDSKSSLLIRDSKRTLPSSFQSSVPSSRPTFPLTAVTSSQIRESYGNSGWQNPHSGRNNLKDRNGRSNDEDLLLYNHQGSRILPPSLSPHSLPFQVSQFASPSDPLRRSGLAEPAVGDERLIYQAAIQDLNQPKVEVTLPDGLMSVPLLRHQKIALAWMLEKEQKKRCCCGGILADDQGLGKTISMIALIQMQKFLSKTRADDSTAPVVEALTLDDDDDDGKGATSVDGANQDSRSDDVQLIPKASTLVQEIRSGRPSAGTLVVCPASVLRQWARELEEKVAEEAKLDALIYHGGNRTKDPYELAAYDVVLTTYAIVREEVPAPLGDDDDDDQRNGERNGILSEFYGHKKRKMTNGSRKGKKGRKGVESSDFDCGSGTLAKVKWERVILDEAQTIKNYRTKVAKSCCGLRAKQRWCLSGTPIQNSIDELFSYFRFMKYDPYATQASFITQLKTPISKDSVKGYKKLQAVLRTIMLRRTKGTLLDGEPIIKLPPKTIELTSVDFSAEERAFYSKLEADSRSQFKAYAAAGTVSQNYANILLMLLRLRQACDHPLLVKGFSSEYVRAPVRMAKSLPKDTVLRLFNILARSLPICRLCSDPPEDAVVAKCGHVFCYQCISEYLTGDDNSCPTTKCREQISHDVIFSEDDLKCSVSEDVDTSSSSGYVDDSLLQDSDYVSSKIKAALEIIRSHCRSKGPQTSNSFSVVRCNGNPSSSGSDGSDPIICLDMDDEGPIKAIVFSQWTSMLDLVEKSLYKYDINFRRLDGTMSLASRDRAVKEFNSDPEVIVMLMSLKAGNLGLNMVAASHVILLDLWWNPTTEDQAVDRAHRIGQTRPVTVSRITIKDTVEDRILALQEEKRKIVASAFGEDNSGGPAARLTVEDLRFLFMGGF